MRMKNEHPRVGFFDDMNRKINEQSTGEREGLWEDSVSIQWIGVSEKYCFSFFYSLDQWILDDDADEKKKKKKNA